MAMKTVTELINGSDSTPKVVGPTIFAEDVAGIIVELSDGTKLTLKETPEGLEVMASTIGKSNVVVIPKFANAVVVGVSG